MSEQYLGDSVYVTMQDGMIVLNADDNRIFIEKQVWESLVKYVAALQPGELQ